MRTFLATTAFAVAAVVVVSAALDRPSPRRADPIQADAARPTARDPGAARAEERLLARVADIEITQGDLRRYNAVARLSGRILVRGHDLDELVSRTLLCLEASSRGIELSPAELAQAVRRRRALAAPAMAAATGTNAIASEDLAAEAHLDALAEKVRRSLVDDQVVVGKRDVDAALRASGQSRSRKDPRVREEFARALRTERGWTLTPGLIAELRQRWHVEVLHEL